MPHPLPPTVSSNKATLVHIFSHYLLSARYGYTTADTISLALVNEIILHKSFGAAFTHEIRGDKMKPSDISTAIANLTNNINDYLTSGNPFASEAEYDEWHMNTGNKFLEDCETYKTFHFGKAQKIINVTMKHLYCYNANEEYFRFCHIALDSMTYTGSPNNSLDGGFYKNEVHPTAITIPFSNLDYNSYIEIQRGMRNYLSTGHHEYIDSASARPLSPFKAEFYIWPRYKR